MCQVRLERMGENSPTGEGVVDLTVLASMVANVNGQYPFPLDNLRFSRSCNTVTQQCPKARILSLKVDGPGQWPLSSLRSLPLS